MQVLTKSIFQSKSFWLAFLQGSVAVVIIFQSAYPTAGWLLIAKSILDIILRFTSTQPVSVAGGMRMFPPDVPPTYSVK